MTYGRSLERHLKYFGLVYDSGKAITFSEWATLAQDRAGWLKLVTKAPFSIGKPQLRPPQCDTRVTPEEKLGGIIGIPWSGSETGLEVHVAAMRSFFVVFAAVVAAVGVAAWCVRGAHQALAVA